MSGIIFPALFVLLFLIGGIISYKKNSSPNIAPALVYIFLAMILIAFIIKNY